MLQRGLDKYAALMSEAARRLEVIDDFASGAVRTTYVRTNTESMSLQLRKILEIVAFSSLVSNRDSYAAVRANIARDWHALRIIAQVEKLNPNFYPRPVDRIDGSGFRFRRSGFLTRRQFEELFKTCGSLLHSTNPFRANRNFAAFSNKIPRYAVRLKALLGDHVVHLAKSDELLRVKVAFEGNHRVVVQHLVKKARLFEIG